MSKITIKIFGRKKKNVTNTNNSHLFLINVSFESFLDDNDSNKCNVRYSVLALTNYDK